MNDWIEWKGGDCPVDDDTRVDIEFRSGSRVYDTFAAQWDWEHSKYSGDVIKYRVCETNETSSEIKPDAINPPHYTSHPSGIQCIEITKHFNFSIGNAVKYLWRAGLKNDAVEDLEKAKWYIDCEIERLKNVK